MNLKMMSALGCAVLLGAGSAFAAGTTGGTQTNAPTVPKISTASAVDYGARCTSLADQFTAAEAANSSNANLGKAKTQAASGKSLCASAKMSKKKLGVRDYTGALKLLGVTPT